MEYTVGTKLCIEGNTYVIIGKIKYKNRNDGLEWFEYRLKNKKTGEEVWLSSDEYYREYSISEVVRNADISGYHIVDRGTEEVVGAWGQVDVEYGDRATFIEYEDSSEEKIISHETWDDGLEISRGHYVDIEDIAVTGSEKINSSVGANKTAVGKSIFFILIPFLFVFGLAGLLSLVDNSPKISDYLKTASIYEYTTSITGENGEKADVYKTSITVDDAVKNIINGIEGNTESIQQNTEDDDNSVAILTKSEYCLVYTSEENETLVQISTRKYTYSSKSEPYHSRLGTRRYYRRYYYSKGYDSDTSTFGGDVSSAYGDFNDTAVTTNNSDIYNSYSASVRQASINSRSSSGGGTSSGK